MINKREETLEGGGLRARFDFQRDRFAHQIWQADGDSWRLVLESIEGSPEESFPASPPLQSLNLESRGPDRRLALLVGMAGKCHWSVSVELAADLGRLTFDIACRVRDAKLGPLLSSYRNLAPLTRLAGEETISLGAAGARGSVIVGCDFPGMRIDPTGDGFRLFAEQPSELSPPYTVRWGYQISLVK